MSRKIVKREVSGDSGGMKINSNMATNMLKRVHLSGLIGDSVVSISSDGYFAVNAIDITNSVFVGVSEKVAKRLDERDIGVGDLKMLIDIFSSAGEENVSISFVDGDSRLVIDWPKKRGSINYLLKDPELVSTAFDGTGNPYKKLMDICGAKVQFSSAKRRDVLSLAKTISISETKKIRLVCNNKIVSFLGGLDTGHKFNIEIGKLSGSVPGRALIFNAEFMMRIFDVLDGDVDIHFGESAPLVIVQDKKNFWSLNEETG